MFHLDLPVFVGKYEIMNSVVSSVDWMGEVVAFGASAHAKVEMDRICQVQIMNNCASTSRIFVF